MKKFWRVLRKLWEAMEPLVLILLILALAAGSCLVASIVIYGHALQSARGHPDSHIWNSPPSPLTVVGIVTELVIVALAILAVRRVARILREDWGEGTDQPE